MTELNSTELNGRLIHLRIDSGGEADPEGSSSIYVGNLPWQVTDEELEVAFSIFKPYYCRVMKNMSGRSRGFAILKFINIEQSQAAIQAMHKYEIDGRAIEVDYHSITINYQTFGIIALSDFLILRTFFSQCRDDRGRSFDASTKRAIFVGKLDFSTTDETLAGMFCEAGTVKSSKIQVKPDGCPRGWG